MVAWYSAAAVPKDKKDSATSYRFDADDILKSKSYNLNSVCTCFRLAP